MSVLFARSRGTLERERERRVIQMNPEEEDDDYEPAFVDASAADVTVHLDLNETDEPPPPDDDDDLDEE